ncbi:unnamed protein product [Mesocestoides corti]|uniref:Tyrosine-protein kinase n=1 Tax=Mesocestoides corti TaxID=53468 RepID=A0A158QUB8_MESCO|nr:unnamed protein product [Mesocestoides corti]
MVYGPMSNFLRKFKRNKVVEKNNEGGYAPPKPAHRWQRRKRREEQAERKRQEMVTENKVNPWFQSCANPRGQYATVVHSFPGGLQDDDLECLKGDTLTIESAYSTEAWWKAENLRTGKTGYIPANYITEEPGVRKILDAWHDIDRQESEAKLNAPGLRNGTYIVRPSSNPLRIALSVLCIVGSTKTIKHFSVKNDPEAGSFFITPSRTFKTLKDLIEYYKVAHDGKPQLLTAPTPRTKPVVQSRDLRISRDKICLKTRLARGGRFGSIYIATYGSLKQPVVIKKLSSHVNRESVIAISEACHKLHHRSVVTFVGLCDEPKSEPLLLVVEYMPGGNLKDFLVQNGKTLDYSKLQNLLYQVIDGMDYIENMKSFHGNLNASNVFLSSELCAKIGNYGFSVQSDRSVFGSPSLENTEAIRWAAPELLEPKYPFDILCDVWSFGVVMFEVFTLGSQPYKDMDLKEIAEKVKTGYRLPNPQSMGFQCDNVMYETMKNCWSADSSDRPTFRELWFAFEESLSQDNEVYAEIE